jgi:hypothetical protein
MPPIGRSGASGTDEDHLLTEVLFKIDKQAGAVEPF